MKKEIKFGNGNLIIGYCDNFQDISVYQSGEYIEPIRFRFLPNIEMTEGKCLECTSENMTKIIEEAKIVITGNSQFYKNFEIDFNSKFTGFSLYSNHLSRDLFVSESWMRLKCKLKENEAVFEN